MKMRMHSTRKRTQQRAGNVRGPRNAEAFFSMSQRNQDAWTRATQVISKMRSEKISLSTASRQVGVDPRTVRRLAASALSKADNGRYTAKRSDRLLRVLVVPDAQGNREIAVRTSRASTQLALYSNAVQRYLQIGDSSQLRKFQNVELKDASGNRITLLTDLSDLNRLGSAGVLSFESLYARTA
jgi:hypothetical protein